MVIGDIKIPCYVLEDETRVLSQRGLMAGLGLPRGSTPSGEDQLTVFANSLLAQKLITPDLALVLKQPIVFKPKHGGRPAHGYPATVLADLCDAVLAARAREKLQGDRLQHIARQCEILVRGFARVGIIALVDEATGYQADREKDALAKILEAFVAKELQPYVRTFPNDYYAELFRLYGLPYPPPGNNKSWRPGFIGNITNDVVYNRLAPELLPDLKRAASKHERRSRLHQWLTQEIGHPKLREHLASIVAILKLSRTPAEFQSNVDRVHPPYNRTMALDFEGGM
jgi:P63C domain